MATLSTLHIGERGKILGFRADCERSYRHKLLAMGLTRGTVFHLLRRAPLGDPVAIEIRGFTLSLRQTEASVLLIEKVTV